MKHTTILMVIGTLLASYFGDSAWGCTGITIRAADGSVVHARSLEWGGVDLQSRATVVPRGTRYVGSAYSGAPTEATAGKKWTSRYGVVGMNMLGMPLVMDGMNEKGLACGTFYLPGFAKYQTVTPDNRAKAIGPGDFNTWVLTQFESVEQLRQSLHEVVVGPAVPAGWTGDMPLHWIVTDSKESIVIESIGGKLVVFDAPLGVITNSPNYDWHMLNLRNWINLRPENVKTAPLGPLRLAPLGEGSGLHGLPGDITPPSRFVRAALFSQFALEPKDAEEAVLTAVRVLNAFYITKGYVRQEVAGQMQYEFTNWEAFADLNQLRYHYRTYDNPNLRMIDLKRIDFAPGKIKMIPREPFVPVDVTGDAKALGSSD